MASPYFTKKVSYFDGSNGHGLTGPAFLATETGVATANARLALLAYAAQYPTNSFPVNIVDTYNSYGDFFTRSYYSAVCEGRFFVATVGNLCQLSIPINKQSLAGQQIASYMRQMAADPINTVFAWDVSYNYISPTSMSINSIGLIFDNNA